MEEFLRTDSGKRYPMRLRRCSCSCCELERSRVDIAVMAIVCRCTGSWCDLSIVVYGCIEALEFISGRHSQFVGGPKTGEENPVYRTGPNGDDESPKRLDAEL